MAKFYYIARDRQGKKITGAEDSPSAEELTTRLQAKDLLVINVLPESKIALEETGIGLRPGKRRRMHRGITNNDLMLFCRQLATLLGSGVTILKSLEIISKQVSSKMLFEVIRDLQKSMESGLSLHESLGKHPRVFSDLWVNLVESGEASGSLAIILDRLAKFLERNAEFKKKIISALIYPGILLSVGMGALLFLTIKIIPTFAELFSGFNMELPLLTRILMVFSNFVRKYFLISIGAIVFGAILIKNYIRTPEGRKQFESMLFRLPVFGEFFRALIVERFSSEISTLIESGVPILYSLEIIEQSVNNLVVGEYVRQMKEDVRVGRPLSEPLDKCGFFEPMVVQMVSIGEEIGELSQMFKRINLFYQDYVETFLARFTAMFEPLMLVFMGGVIGIMVLGMFLPIFQISRIGAGG